MGKLVCGGGGGGGGGAEMTWKDMGCSLLKMCDVERDGWC